MDTKPKTRTGAKRVMIFGATGMLGKGVLRECLNDAEVEQVVTVGRKATGDVHEKIKEIEHSDLTNFNAIEEDMKNVDAVFWTVGITSLLADEAQYELVTKTFPIAAADVLNKHNPNMTFVLVTADGTDANGSLFWKRMKGDAENNILERDWNGYVFRPAVVQPIHDETSRTLAYRIGYVILKPFIPVFETFFPDYMTTTERMGRAFLHLARHGHDGPERIFNSRGMNALAAKAQQASL